MNITFLGQGYEPDSVNAVGNYLIKFLSDEQFHTFWGISAFASEAGIRGLSDYLTNTKVQYNLIVGVDQEGTSKEALNEILKLGINSYIFYQTETIIFHPKIYLFESLNETKLILGSSNLTAKGLFSNVEGSFLIEFNNSDLQGSKLLKELKKYYQNIFDLTDPNLFKITQEIIELFVNNGIVPIENNRNFSYKKDVSYSIGEVKEGKLVIPKRQMAKFPSAFKGRSRKFSTVMKIAEELQLPKSEIPNSKILLWKKDKLSKSDAQRISSGTNPTGNLKLAQGGFKKDGLFVNQQKYFRETVFGFLNWAKTNSKKQSYEETFADFRILILGNDFGIHTLKLSHDPTRVAGQGNTPTWLHWGHEVGKIVQSIDISSKSLNLFLIQNDFTFLIEIV